MVPAYLAAGLDPPVRRARRRPQAHARARAARPRRHRVPAIHGRHDRRREGRDAAPPQHRRQPAAGARVGPAVPRPDRREVIITPLPLYHIFSLTANCLVFMTLGGENILIPNPRDIPGFVKEMAQVQVHRVHRRQHAVQRAGQQPGVRASSTSRRCELTLGGGMAVQEAVAQEVEGGHRRAADRGLRPDRDLAGGDDQSARPARRTTASIGLPIPSTEIMLRDDAGNDVRARPAGEICIRGPQVMAGYWQRPDETAKVIDKDGWFATGDIGVMDERGFVRIVDRKKDMILVSGFNVYPNEIEGVVAMHPGVLECAAVGVPDKKSGEAVKLFVVKKDPGADRGGRAEVLPRAPDRLQVPARRRVPHRAAEVERRQDPAPRVARRGEEGRGSATLTGVASPWQALRRCPTSEPVLRVVPMPADVEPPRRHLRRLDHVAGRHRRAAWSRRAARAAASRRSPSIRSCSSSRC